MKIRRRDDHSLILLWRRTFSAQIHLIGAILLAIGGTYLLPAAHGIGPDYEIAAWVFILTGIIVFSGSFLFHFLGCDTLVG